MKHIEKELMKKKYTPIIGALLLACILALVSSIMYKLKAGNVVILIGTSSSGKTSIVKELKKIYGNAYEIVGIDSFLSSYSDPSIEQNTDTPDEERKKQLGEEYAQKFINSFYSLIREKALKGQNVLVDTVPVLESDLEYKIITEIFKDIKAIKILLYCPLDITIARVEQRNLTGISEEQRIALQPIGQYQLLYKKQETESACVLDRVSSDKMKQLLRSAVHSFMENLPEELQSEPTEEIAKNLEDSYEKFIMQFKLDESEKIEVVSKHRYDLTLDCRNTPAELAQKIVKFIQTQTS